MQLQCERIALAGNASGGSGAIAEVCTTSAGRLVPAYAESRQMRHECFC
jgi:hypothetical protein